MKYVIRNHKNIYIRLNENGKAVTCSESEAGLFEFSKAKNISRTLPKNLERLKFYVDAVPDIQPKINKDIVAGIKKKIIETNNKEVSENILSWVEKFGKCSDIFNDAVKRTDVLAMELDRLDQEMIDILHNIELESSKDLYGGWILYKRIRNNRKKRRVLKDEILIIKNVLEKIDPSCLNRSRIQKAIDGLFKRKYTYRIVEEEKYNAV